MRPPAACAFLGLKKLLPGPRGGGTPSPLQFSGDRKPIRDVSLSFTVSLVAWCCQKLAPDHKTPCQTTGVDNFDVRYGVMHYVWSSFKTCKSSTWDCLLYFRGNLNSFPIEIAEDSASRYLHHKTFAICSKRHNLPVLHSHTTGNL